LTDDLTTPARRDPRSQETDPARGITLIDAQTLKSLIRFGLGLLERHQALINSLNVYPVPDGDTGTNMLLTMQSACREIGENPDDDAGAIAQKLAHGALMGARGNSGVILSQIFRGFGHGLAGIRAFDAVQFGAALREGAATAYKGVIKPVEGTILTVARESADAAVAAAADCDDLRIVLEQVVHEARQSVARTPTLLPVLAEAGVVDAGGQGLLVILEGMLRCLRGEELNMEPEISSAIDLKAPGPAGEEGYGYDIQFIIHGDGLDVEAIRDAIASMGDSALVVGDSNTIKVHVHSPDPGTPISYGASCGSLSRVIVEDMQEQYQEFLVSKTQRPVGVVPLGGIGTVVVAPGEGFTQVFASLGASRVVPGGQTMNPSTEQILQAMEEVLSDEVIVLPNNKNIIPTAEQAKSLCKKRVEVIPTITVPQGIAALLALNYQADLATNARAMADAAAAIETAEITTAVRSTQVNGLSIQEGDFIALVDGRIHAKGSSPVEVALAALKEMHTEAREIITIYYGEPVTPSEAQALADEVTGAFPEQEVELINGGQPHYHYIVSAE
jgi:DAK2 domain fusion protein YloV